MEKFKTLTVFNPKGGVGKSTIIMSLAFELSKHGKTLVIDGDPQGSETYLMLDEAINKEEDKNRNLFTLFNNEIELKDAIFRAREESEDNEYKGLYVLPAGEPRKLRAFISSQYQNGPEKNFKEILDDAKEIGFNYVLVDLPGALNFYEGSILSQLNEIIPITESEDLSKESLEQFFTDLKKITSMFISNVKFSKYIIINKFSSDNKVHQHFIKTLERKYPLFVQVIINNSKIASSSNSQHLAFQEYSAGNKNTKMIQMLASKIL